MENIIIILSIIGGAYLILKIIKFLFRGMFFNFLNKEVEKDKEELQKEIKDIKNELETEQLKYEKLKGNLTKDLKIAQKKLNIILEEELEQDNKKESNDKTN